MDGGRVCAICHEWKKWEEFSKQKNSKSGFRSYCKKCYKETYDDPRTKRNQEKNLGRDPYDGTDKTCYYCQEVFPRIKMWWYSSPSAPDGLNNRCLDCLSISMIKFNAKKNGEVLNLPTPFTGKEARALKAKQNYCCYVCGHRENGKRLHLDHNHTTGRIRGYACEECNKKLLYWLDKFVYEDPILMRAFLSIDTYKRILCDPPAKFLYENSEAS